MAGISGIGIWADKPGSANIRTARNDGTTPITGADISPTTYFLAEEVMGLKSHIKIHHHGLLNGMALLIPSLLIFRLQMIL